MRIAHANAIAAKMLKNDKKRKKKKKKSGSCRACDGQTDFFLRSSAVADHLIRSIDILSNNTFGSQASVEAAYPRIFIRNT